MKMGNRLCEWLLKMEMNLYVVHILRPPKKKKIQLRNCARFNNLSLSHLWLWLQEPFEINLVNINGTEVPTVVQEWM